MPPLAGYTHDDATDCGAERPQPPPRAFVLIGLFIVLPLAAAWAGVLLGLAAAVAYHVFRFFS